MKLGNFYTTLRFSVAALALGGLVACASAGGESERSEDATGKEVASALMRAGEASRQRGDYAAAAAFYARAESADPKSIDAPIGMGESLAAGGAGREAADAFRKALVIDPKNTRALRGLGNALIAQDQADLAIEQFEKALAIDPRDYRAYSGLGVAYDTLANHDKAQEFYYAGLEIAPNDTVLRNNLGLSLAFAGHYKGAIEILRPLALRPGATARDRQNLALVYGLSGDVEQAKKFSRLDMDNKEVERNLSYYAALRSIADPVLRVKSVRAGYAMTPK